MIIQRRRVSRPVAGLIVLLAFAAWLAWPRPDCAARHDTNTPDFAACTGQDGRTP